MMRTVRRHSLVASPSCLHANVAYVHILGHLLCPGLIKRSQRSRSHFIDDIILRQSESLA